MKPSEQAHLSRKFAPLFWTSVREGGDKPTSPTTHLPVFPIELLRRLSQKPVRKEGVVDMKRILMLALVGAFLGFLALAQEKEPAEANLPAAEEEITVMESAFGEVVEFFSAFIAELKGAIAALNAEDEELNAKYQALAVQLKDAEAKLIQLKMVCDQVPGLSDRVAAVEETMKSLADALSSHSEKIADLTAQLEKEVKDLLAQLSAQVADHEKRIKRLEDQDLGHLQRRVLALEQAVQALQAKIENNRAKIEGFEASLADLSARIGSLEAQMATLSDGFVSRDEFGSFKAETEAKLQELQGALGGAQGIAILALLIALGSLAYMFLGGAGG